MPVETLPSLVTVDALTAPQRALRVTIVFHPELSRIGCHADLVTWSQAQPRPPIDLTLGRLQGLFSDGRPLEEPHVSRRALQLRSERGGVTVAAAGSGVKCRIGAHETDKLWLGDDHLAAGVPVRLGHGVVLYLREVQVPAVAPEVPIDAFPGCAVETVRLRQLIAAAAATDLPVLILGGSGAGKEMVARAIHFHSARREQRLVSVNIAAIAESLAAAELFGTAKGAYTGAESRAGFFQQAHRGSLFLDEIGDTPAQVQVQLLRVLQEGEVQVVGGPALPVDVRVIAATDASVEADSGFRHALRQRLAGMTLQLRPLRSRPEDVGPQVLRMLAVAGIASDELLAAGLRDDPNTAAWWARVFYDFTLVDWSGNSRELQHAVTRSLVMEDRAWAYALEADQAANHVEISDAALEQVYEAHGFEVSSTAIALGLSRTATYRRIDKSANCRVANQVSEEELDAAIATVGADAEKLSRRLRVSARGLLPRLAQRQLRLT